MGLRRDVVKKQRQMAAFVVWMVLGFAFFCAPVYGGGIALYEIGPSQTGLASAGWASRADDASTLFTNPAGMTRLKKSEFLTGIQPLYTDIKLSPNARTTTTGTGNDSQNWLPTGSLYYVHNVSPDLKLGLGVLGYFGLSLDYGDHWVGRYYTQEETLQGITIQPTAAYKLTDKLSVGAGLNAMYGILDDKKAINNAGERPDGQLKLDDNEWGYGANLGVLYELDSKTRFGINYLSQVELKFKTTPKFSGLGPTVASILYARGLLNADLDLAVKVPQMVMVSFYRDLNDRWAIMADVGWQQWSKFGKVDVDLDAENSIGLTTNLHYKDTWHYALGAQWRISTPWLLMFGAAYDSSPVHSADMTVSLPMGETYRFGAGAQYQWNQRLALGLSYEVAWMGNLKVDQFRGPLAGRVSGEYKDTAIDAIMASLRYQF
jgi:long-chain fatty acid transport protein